MNFFNLWALWVWYFGILVYFRASTKLAGANPGEVERAPWRSSQSAVARPQGLAIYWTCLLILILPCASDTSSDPSGRTDGSFSLATEGSRHSPTSGISKPVVCTPGSCGFRHFRCFRCFRDFRYSSTRRRPDYSSNLCPPKI